MTDLIARVKVMLTALPTWLTGLAVLVAVSNDELAGLLPQQWQATLITVLAWLTAAVNIVRRVTPVPASQQGLLSPPKPAAWQVHDPNMEDYVPDPQENPVLKRDGGQTSTVALVVIVALLVILMLVLTNRL